MPFNSHHKLEVKRKPNKINMDTARGFPLPHLPDNPDRISMIILRIVRLGETCAGLLIADVIRDFSNRHEDLLRIFERHLKAN
ncbi:MAG: hypothetical protein HUN05_15280 [Desulfobacter sp.]|nr:MAG: hypothetical protein HUN05_15280 [Desulfobacter sp.]